MEPTIREIRNAIPAHCFQPKLSRSLTYVLRSFILVIVLFYGALIFIPQLPTMAKSLAWVVYWFFQGTAFWGIFVLAHDCGHGSFSANRRINFWVGVFLNSAILAPHESWRLSHRHHHQFTGNIDKDEVFYPMREEESDKITRAIPIFMGFAWFLYLFVGFYPRKIPHFNIWHEFYKPYRKTMMLSLLGWCTALALVIVSIFYFGFVSVLMFYLMPIVVFSSWLVIVTFLHHNHPTIKWYSDDNWTFVKGAVSSVDRSYGLIVDTLSHNIGTHQVHHLFPGIPHYYLKEATKAFREKFPQLVNVSDDRIIPAYFKNLANYIKYGGNFSQGMKQFTYQEQISENKIPSANQMPETD